MNYIILDTNIFIHFKDFDQIDWKEILNDQKKEFTIMIPPTVIKELDGHKYNKNPKISRRVKRILPKIESYITSPLKDFNIQLIERRPDQNTFIENHLNINDQDDCILATILEFKHQINEDDNLLYLTYDTAPRLKAKTLSINSLKIDEKYLLPSEPDENERKNKELEKELTKFKNQLPKIILSFVENEKFIKIEKKKDYKNKELFISESVNKIKKKFNYLQKVLIDDNPNTILRAVHSFGVSDEQIKKYNSDLNIFFTKYEQYYSSAYDHFIYENDCVKIKLKISNVGTAPANDIDIQLHFPDGFELHEKNKLPEIIREPTPPFKPRNRFDIQTGGFSFPITNHHKAPTINYNLNSPHIKKTNSYNVDFHLRNLKHNQAFEFEVLYLKYEDRNLAKNFKIDYKILINNYPDVVSGVLNVLME